MVVLLLSSRCNILLAVKHEELYLSLYIYIYTFQHFHLVLVFCSSDFSDLMAAKIACNVGGLAISSWSGY